MKRWSLYIGSLLPMLCSLLLGQDWANLEKYRQANLELGTPAQDEVRVVFMGNSITEGWPQFDPSMFQDEAFICRGISGQTTPQLLVRFRPDVIDLRPAVVVILAGTNDIAGNTGPMTLEMIFGNIVSMVELARANNIEVVLASVLPAFQYPWKPTVKPAEEIYRLNRMLSKYARQEKLIYLDYYQAMVDSRKGLKAELTYDGVHPNLEGYKVMGPLARNAITEALNSRR